MLIDVRDPRSINLTEYPGKLVAAVHVRSWEKNPEECAWGSSEVHGEEGVWRMDDEIGNRQHVRLEPFDQTEPYRLLFELRPVFLEPPRPHVLSRFRWLIRYWDADVYMPTIHGLQVTASAHLEDDELFWSVAWGRHSVSGITLHLE